MVDAVKMTAGLRGGKSWGFNEEELQEAPGLNYQGSKSAAAHASMPLGASDLTQLQVLQQMQQLLGPSDFTQLQTLPQLQQLQALQMLAEQQQLLQSQASCLPALQPHLYNSLAADSFLLNRDNQGMGCSLPMHGLLPLGNMPMNDPTALFSALPWQLMGGAGASALTSQPLDLMSTEALPAALASLSFSAPQNNSSSSSTTDVSLTGSPMGESTDMLSFGSLPGSLPHLPKTLSDLTEAVGSPMVGSNNCNSPSLEQQVAVSAAALAASRLSQSSGAADFATGSNPPGLQSTPRLSGAMCLTQGSGGADVYALLGGSTGTQSWDHADLKCLSARDDLAAMSNMI
jgi:hypothetical protein